MSRNTSNGSEALSSDPAGAKRDKPVRHRQSVLRTLAPYLFVAPAFSIVFIFVIVAALNTFRLAFTDSTLLVPGKFIGFQNFVDIFHDEYFWTALLNSTLYVVCVVPFMVILPLILASLVRGNSKIMGFFRTSFYTPVVMSAVVVGMIWTNLLDSKGLINSLLEGMHLIKQPIPFLTDRWMILFSAMFVTIWLGLGYYMVIYLTALANIDDSLYEAASLDGAGPVRKFVSITMPGVRSTIVLIMMLSTIAAFRVFNEIYVLTNGTAGPGGQDITMSMMIQQEGTGIQAHTGYASALSLIVLVIVGFMLIVQQIFQSRSEN
ncbi:multiple sugar transport system permease protein [Bifidobacterium bohemicum]|uniref:ABC transporter, permease protein n=1 Tax=Bifidobacterium bohemicum DSM 22767 TaxID=1437606 RepID=A0A086ZKB6_9BIFI|nr:sugar ABC transporter permease [Bifidobacterium bohemicum]KFI46966.1 ABC transporter, permease protein [Bifidobacterium bohemicum DSM 22767]SCB86446.1 multiple sugar transport system permease protein [Bifidobacterium bohemicum]